MSDSVRLKLRTEKLTIASAGVSQPIKATSTQCWSLTIQSDDTNALKFYFGNDGNDTVDADSGEWLDPGCSKEFRSENFFSAYSNYIDLSDIYVFSDEAATFRISYWVGVT